jgi:hypothetical protein
MDEGYLQIKVRELKEEVELMEINLKRGEEAIRKSVIDFQHLINQSKPLIELLNGSNVNKIIMKNTQEQFTLIFKQINDLEKIRFSDQKKIRKFIEKLDEKYITELKIMKEETTLFLKDLSLSVADSLEKKGIPFDYRLLNKEYKGR